jgi:AAA family ATP:ADP antiporter
VRGVLRRVVQFEEGEGAALVWSCAYFFFLMSSYFIFRPLRDAMGVARGDEGLTWLYTGTLVGTLIANPIFSALISRYPRRVFLPLVYHFLAVNLLGFWALLRFLPHESADRVAVAFFVWTSVFNLFAVSVFWGFMADLFRSDQGKRLFGFIAVGGTLGAVAGASVTTSLAPLWGPVNLILVAIVLLEAAVFCMRRLVRIFGADRAAAAGPAEAERPPGHGTLAGLRLVFSSPYLLGICAFLFLYTISSTFLYFEQARIVRACFASTAERTAFLARIDLFAQLLTGATQLLLSGRILSWLGVGLSLSTLPVVTAGALVALAVSPSAGVLLVVQVLRRSTEYALVRPSREVLFTATSREEKYASKSLIDTFVYRGGDGAGAWLGRLLTAWNVGMSALAMAFLPIAAAWIALAAFLGRRQAAMSASSQLRGAPGPPPERGEIG